MLLIYGPTATGKTDLGIALAKKFNGEIISADSRQVYKSLDIGTGKVNFKSKVEKHNKFWIVDQVKINGFDLVDPGTNFTVANFIKFANNSMIRIIESKRLPIIVGGTGFYINALINGIETIGIKPNLKLRRELENLSPSQLYQKLRWVNPTRAEKMNQSDRANPRRLIRAIEIAQSGNKTPTHYQQPTTNNLIIGLTAQNDFLYQRTDRWINTRLNNGMMEEVKNLLDHKIDPKWLDDLGLEYRWLSRFLLGKIGKSEAIDRLKRDSHNFIRHQKTWFKQFKYIRLFDISQPSWKNELEKKVSLWYDTNT